MILNNLDKNVYVNVSSDQPNNVVAYYSEVVNFLRGEEEYTDPSYTKIEINKLTELPGKSHYYIGVTVLRAGLSYNIEHYREALDFTMSFA